MVAMNVSLTPELARMVRNKVKEGQYSNASEVIREALRLLYANDNHAESESQLAALKLELELGVKQAVSGDTVAIDVDALIKQLDAEA